MKKITKSFLNWLPAITLGIVLGSFLQLAQAWKEPGSRPPKSNIGAPVTTGSASQYKSGALGVNGLLRGYGRVMGNELCFGWNCRSSWQDLYKSGDKVCIESGGCVDVADNYIGNSGTHYAGGNLSMRGRDITNVDDVRLNDIYKQGWGDIDVYDNLNMRGRDITNVDDVRLNDIYKQGWGDIDVYDNLNMRGNDITNVGDITASGRMHISGPERSYFLNDKGLHVSDAWGGSGSLTVSGVASLHDNLNMHRNNIKGVRTPDRPDHAANKKYVDDKIANLNLSCRVIKKQKTHPLSSAFFVSCPSGYERTGCTATCRGHWSKTDENGDWDLDSHSNKCSLDRNSRCFGSDPIITLRAICCKIN
ncbi:MAG: hypothetical protein ACOCUF_01090 [Patescibacteria group bacterium]